MRLRFLAVALLSALLFCGLPALAATFTVTTAADSGAGSLREAMTLAETNGEADEIVFNGDYTIPLASTLPTVTTPMTIRGNGWDRTIVDGGNPPGGSSGVRAFQVEEGGELTLDGVMVRNCYSGSDGGAIRNIDGSLTVVNTSLRGNSAWGGYGGALVSWGWHTPAQLTLRRCLVEGNSKLDGNGVVAVLGDGQNVIEESGFFSNTGGAMFAQGAPLVTISNSTFIANDVAVRLMWAHGNVAGTTISGSTTAIHAWGSSASVSLSHTALADSSAAGCVLNDGAVLSTLGRNLEEGNTCGLNPALGDLVDTDPQLGPMQHNGGPTPTRAPLPGSPLIDAGEADCGLTIDQRGIQRPFDGDRDGTALCDIGAVEYDGIFYDGFVYGDTTAWSVTVP